MDLHATLATGVVVLPAGVGALALVLPPLARRVRLLAVAASAGSLLLVALLLADGASGVLVVWDWAPELFVRVAWRLDAATLAFAALVSGVGVLVLQFAGAYFGATEKGQRAIAWLAIFEASMLGLVLADELLLLFTFWELTGLCSFFLINTDADKRDDCFAAAQQALLITVGGALPMLLGFLYLALQTGTSSLAALAAMDVPRSVQSVALALILPGVLTKSAQVPFHFWLPGAMAAPTPISAYLHSATMVKAGLILLLYLFPVCGTSALWSAVLVPIGAATCIWGSRRALAEDDVKLLMAWSTVSQLGLMTITVGLGTDLAVRAAALYLFAHAVFKAGLFLSIGAIDHAAHTRLLSQLGGLGRRAPLLCGAVAVLAGSMAGLPPFAGFLSKELVLKKLMLADPLVHDVAVIGIVLGSIGTVAYSARFLFGCFAGAPRSESAARAQAPSLAFVFAPALLGALSLAGGLGAAYTDRWLVEPVSAALLGYPLGVPQLALWHGVNVPLVLSGLILTLGGLAYWFLGGRQLPHPPDWLQGPRLFEGFLETAQRLGNLCNRALAGAPPGVYLAAAVGFGLAAALPLAPRLGPALAGDWDVRGVMALVLLTAGLLLLVALASRVGRVLALTAVGFGVSLLYAYLHAPDLVLTQLLVEVLTTVFFLLALRHVSRSRQRRPLHRLLRLLRVGLAAAAGLAAASLAAALQQFGPDGRLSDYYFEAGPAIAEGTNLVNLLLGDFRALDTLVETGVVLLAGLGAVALLLGRELPPRGERRG